MTQPMSAEPKPQADELFEDWRTGDAGEFLPFLYVVHSRGGMTGPGLPAVDLVRGVTDWGTVLREIAARLAEPGPVMVRLGRPNRRMADRYTPWSADLQIDGAYFAASRPSSPPPPPSPSSWASQPPPPPPAPLPLAAEISLSRELMADADRRNAANMQLFLSTLKEERQELLRMMGPQSRAPGSDASPETSYKLGEMTATLKALQERPAGNARSTLEILLDSPTVAAIGDRLLSTIDRVVSVADKKARAEEAAADARLLASATRAQAAGVDVSALGASSASTEGTPVQ